MRFSIWTSSARTWPEILEIVTHGEATGWDGVYFADHFMPDSPAGASTDGSMLECWSVLAALASSVPRLRLAPLVTSVTYRHPAVLANVAAAVDQISGGRLTLGLGAGWQHNEHTAYGLQLGTIRERLDRFEEAVQMLRSMLGEPRTTFTGKYFQLADAPNQPPPAQTRCPFSSEAGASGGRCVSRPSTPTSGTPGRRPRCSPTRNRYCVPTARTWAATGAGSGCPLRP